MKEYLSFFQMKKEKLIQKQTISSNIDEPSFYSDMIWFSNISTQKFFGKPRRVQELNLQNETLHNIQEITCDIYVQKSV